MAHPDTALETWVAAYMATHHPGMTRDDRVALYRGSALLQDRYADFRQAKVDGFQEDILATARLVCVAWAHVFRKEQSITRLHTQVTERQQRGPEGMER